MSAPHLAGERATSLRCALLGVAAFVLSAGPAYGAVAIPDTVYDGYFVSNQFQPGAASSFIILRDQAGFDQVFGVAAVMHVRSRRLPANVFRTSLVIAAIHRGHANVAYRMVKVVRDGTILKVRYTTTVTSHPADRVCLSPYYFRAAGRLLSDRVI